ncbi:MBL fold metallo-hydrolase [Atlantibacter sp.]|uniref:MBL fold metallo-hydrolase n=1 Tax=Atlantibacter sp. TaxID=1903473 RepID=UPI00289B29ED|nr:MBL fold metallo-hydrolase [Atlantibacter sp.]
MAWKNPWYDPSKPHHLESGFRNLHPVATRAGDYQRWQKARKANGYPPAPQHGYDRFIEQWWQPADFSHAGDGVWWLGHASLLFALQGQYILTDPVFSKRASPLTFFGPERKSPLPFAPPSLPNIDTVLISHNHYDHFDSATIRFLRRHSPDATWFVPLGLKAWFIRRGITRVVELDWWQAFTHNGLVYTAIPAQHWSMRTPWDRNRTLWCGWAIETSHFRAWFCGDTGYHPMLHDITQRLGPIDVAAIPIGAYEPRWFMGANHMDPECAVRLWQKIGRPLAIPIHWGVFELADEAIDAPPEALLMALKAAGETTDIFAPIKIGHYSALNRK